MKKVVKVKSYTRHGYAQNLYNWDKSGYFYQEMSKKAKIIKVRDFLNYQAYNSSSQEQRQNAREFAMTHQIN